jgi:hypothetical protein
MNRIRKWQPTREQRIGSRDCDTTIFWDARPDTTIKGWHITLTVHDVDGDVSIDEPVAANMGLDMIDIGQDRDATGPELIYACKRAATYRGAMRTPEITIRRPE